MEGDTIIGIWPQEAKGNGLQLLSPHSIAPRLWYREKISESCLFLIDNKFTCEPKLDDWSHFKKVTYTSSELGYLSVFYAGTVKGKNVPVSVEGILFDK